VKLQHKPPASTLSALARNRLCDAAAVACAIVSARSRPAGGGRGKRRRPSPSTVARARRAAWRCGARHGEAATCWSFPNGARRAQIHDISLRQPRPAHNAACRIERRVRSTRPDASFSVNRHASAGGQTAVTPAAVIAACLAGRRGGAAVGGLALQAVELAPSAPVVQAATLRLARAA
jgi:hypothetical protein